MNTIKVLPNSKNQVNIPVPVNSGPSNTKIDIDKLENGTNTFFRDLDGAVKTPGCCSIIGHCSRMEQKIVKYAKTVLENNEKLLIKDAEDQEINKRMVKIEKAIDEILLKINLVTEKFKNS